MSEHGESRGERLGDALVLVICVLGVLALLATGWPT
jgi:hypothetical protein